MFETSGNSKWPTSIPISLEKVKYKSLPTVLELIPILKSRTEKSNASSSLFCDVSLLV